MGRKDEWREGGREAHFSEIKQEAVTGSLDMTVCRYFTSAAAGSNNLLDGHRPRLCLLRPWQD